MKKKGFTLVELLAVIVILAIIALITVPIVLKTISNSEVQAEKQSVEGYARVIEDDKANEEMLHPGQQYQIKPEEEYEYKGNKVFCENKYFDEKEKLVLENCYVSDKEITDPEQKAKKNFYNYKNGKVELIKNNNNSTNNNQENNENTVNNNTNNNKTYEIGEEITVKNEKYNVIGQGSDYVTLLKQTPLTANEINTYGGVGTDNNHVNMYVAYYTSSSYYHQAYDFGDTNHTGGMAYYSSITCGYNGSSWIYDGCTTDYNSSEVKYVVDAWASDKFQNNELKEVDNYKARLVEKEELRSQFYPSCSSTAGYCKKESTTPTWLYNSNSFYWTMSQWNSSSTNMWGVNSNGNLNGISSNGRSVAVRPAINVYKSKLS